MKIKKNIRTIVDILKHILLLDFLLFLLSIDEVESSFTNSYKDISKMQPLPRDIIQSGKLKNGTEFRLGIYLLIYNLMKYNEKV